MNTAGKRMKNHAKTRGGGFSPSKAPYNIAMPIATYRSNMHENKAVTPPTM